LTVIQEQKEYNIEAPEGIQVLNDCHGSDHKISLTCSTPTSQGAHARTNRCFKRHACDARLWLNHPLAATMVEIHVNGFASSASGEGNLEIPTVHS
jgi:hypothetical protein